MKTNWCSGIERFGLGGALGRGCRFDPVLYQNIRLDGQDSVSTFVLVALHVACIL